MELEAFLSEQERLELMGKIDWSTLARHDQFGGNSLSSHGGSDYRLKTNDFLSDKILERMRWAVNLFAERYGVGQLKITNYWANIFNSGGSLKRHLHAGSVLSGVIFVNVDEKSNPLVFWNPNPHNQFTNFERQTELNFQSYHFVPQNGLMLLWPSWLEHGSGIYDNGSDNRVSISFNTEGL